MSAQITFNVASPVEAIAQAPRLQIRETAPPESAHLTVTVQQLVERLSFSHVADLLQYALADMSNQLFVSRYQVQLPGTEEMAGFLHKAVEEWGGGDE